MSAIPDRMHSYKSGVCAWSGATLDSTDTTLLLALQDGLPLIARPYRAIGARVGLPEGETIARIARLLDRGVIKRMGVIVRHHELGYLANAMVVWDIPDDEVQAIGRRMALCDAVRLCYRRPRRAPHWPYNLFCMIHGRSRAEVWDKLDHVIGECGLRGCTYEVLFSTRRFKQRGAHYGSAQVPAGREDDAHG